MTIFGVHFQLQAHFSADPRFFPDSAILLTCPENCALSIPHTLNSWTILKRCKNKICGEEEEEDEDEDEDDENEGAAKLPLEMQPTHMTYKA